MAVVMQGSVTGWFDLSNEESHPSQLLVSQQSECKGGGLVSKPPPPPCPGTQRLPEEEHHCLSPARPRNFRRAPSRSRVRSPPQARPSLSLTISYRLSESLPIEKEFSEFMNFNQFEANVGILWTTRAYGAGDA
eukprot:608625-Hanusia_phi.AAC.4